MTVEKRVKYSINLSCYSYLCDNKSASQALIYSFEIYFEIFICLRSANKFFSAARKKIKLAFSKKRKRKKIKKIKKKDRSFPRRFESVRHVVTTNHGGGEGGSQYSDQYFDLFLMRIAIQSWCIKSIKASRVKAFRLLVLISFSWVLDLSLCIAIRKRRPEKDYEISQWSYIMYWDIASQRKIFQAAEICKSKVN